MLQQRKLMSKKEYKGRHHNWGGLIMGLGTATAVAGPINTYLRAGMQLCLRPLVSHAACPHLTCCQNLAPSLQANTGWQLQPLQRVSQIEHETAALTHVCSTAA